MAGVIYKPSTRKGPVFISPNNTGSAPTVTLPDGRVISAVRADKAGGTFKGHEGYQWVFPKDVLGHRGAVLSYGDSQFTMGNSNMSYRGSSMGSLKESSKGAIGSAGGYQPGSTFGGGFGGGQAMPTFVDSSRLSPGMLTMPQIPYPTYNMVDPITYSNQVGANNVQNYVNNLNTAQQSAMSAVGTDIQANMQFGPSMQVLQQYLAGRDNQFTQSQISQGNMFNLPQVGIANRFNQQELNAALDSTGVPFASTIKENLENASTRARGFLPTTIEDRAFELAARTKAGDALTASGLGTSSAMQNAMDKFTIGERLALAREGQSDTGQWLAQAANLLVSTPQKYNPLLSQPVGSNISQGIDAKPSFSPGAYQQSEQANLGNLTSISPGAALASATQQNQFKTTMQSNTDQFNAQMNYNTQSFNITNDWNRQINQMNMDVQNAMWAWQFAQNMSNQVNAMYQAGIANQANTMGNLFGNNKSSGVSGGAVR